MPTNNFKLFDENKTNILTDAEYASNTQRQNGVQTGVASSKLNNKFSYQTSLVAYAIAQIMNANGKNASDADAVATFVANLQGSLVQKVLDCASSAEAIAGVINNKYITPATMKAAALMLAGGTMTGPLYLSRDPVEPLEAATKQWVEGATGWKVFDTQTIDLTGSGFVGAEGWRMFKKFGGHDITIDRESALKCTNLIAKLVFIEMPSTVSIPSLRVLFNPGNPTYRPCVGLDITFSKITNKINFPIYSWTSGVAFNSPDTNGYSNFYIFRSNDNNPNNSSETLFYQVYDDTDIKFTLTPAVYFPSAGQTDGIKFTYSLLYK